MRPIATDVARSVVCVSVCVLNTRVNCAKTAKLIEMPTGWLTRVGPKILFQMGSDPHGRVTFDGDMCRTIVTPCCLSPLANVPAQRT